MFNRLFFLLASFSLAHFSLQAQNIEVGHTYYFKTNLGSLISSEKMKLNEKDALPQGVTINRRDQIRVVDIENDRVYFEYLLFNDSISPEKYEIYNLAKKVDGIIKQNKRIFSMTKDDFERYTNFFYQNFRGFRYGSYTVPIRLRSSGGIFEFDSNLSLGTNIVGRFGSRFNESRYIDFSFGIGITKVNLNKENSDLGIPGSEFEDIEVLSPASFTMSLGVLIGLGQNINVGGHIGWDALSTADNRANWIYNKKPWFGIGIGFQFDDKSTNSNRSTNQIE